MKLNADIWDDAVRPALYVSGFRRGAENRRTWLSLADARREQPERVRPPIDLLKAIDSIFNILKGATTDSSTIINFKPVS